MSVKAGGKIGEKFGLLPPRYRFHPQVRRIARHRHLPKMVYKAAKEKRIMMAAQKRKRENVVKHSKPGAVKIVPERQKHVVGLVK